MRNEQNGVGIEFDVHGTGTPVVLLHGFPDSARLWRKQVPALVDAGFQVIVPDQRGFGRSSKPPAVSDYAMPYLVQDVFGILTTLGLERVHLVGHDWGAAVAWAFAALAPQQVDHLGVLSVGHPGAFLTAGIPQLQRSWYMFLFQFEGVAEEWLTANNWANARAWMQHPDHDEVVAALESANSLTSALSWYRANLPPRAWIDGPPALPPVQAPAMGVWSSGDIALTEQQMIASEAFVAGSWRYERLEGCGHWMQLQAPDEVNRLLVDFLPPAR